jgi:uncharacterized protein YjbI with pentapeptide repeats
MAAGRRKRGTTTELVTGLTFDREPLPSSLAEKAGDLDALRTTVVDAATVSGALWLSYLFVLFYFLIAAGSVTHRDLFLENPVRLPFLNVDLPLQGFFWLGPLIFLIVHAYVLLHFVVLAGKVRAFDTALVAQVTWAETRAGLRRQLPSSIFVQFLAGPREVRLGVTGWLLWLVAVVSLVAGPVLVQLFFELQFLPYHDEPITWLQRFAVLLDLGLLWLLWPKIAARDNADGAIALDRWTGSGRLRLVWRGLLVGLTASVGVLIPLVTTFPGESLDAAARDIHIRIGGGDVLGELRTALVEGEVDPASLRPISPFSNILVLPGLDIIDHTRLDSDAKIDALRVTVSLRGRDLRRAVLTGAVLRKASFTAADLREARLEGADLRGARFGCATWRERCAILTAASLDNAKLEDASLDWARLQGASLNGASLQGASLNDANLQGASLDGASLQGASLDGASLEGASLNGASLQGASLKEASLQGANLLHASLQGASLYRASLQGALLQGASLHGASLDRASLQGTSLFEASFRGASLVNASLQGARLGRTSFRGASLVGACVWRADPKYTFFDGADLGFVDTGLEVSQWFHWNVCPETAESFRTLREAIAAQRPGVGERDAALSRIDPFLNPDEYFPQETDIAERWRTLRTQTAWPDVIEPEREKQLRQTGCAADSAPHVVAALASRLKDLFSKNSPHVSTLAAAFLDPTCDGARGISPETTAQLKAFTHPFPPDRP